MNAAEDKSPAVARLPYEAPIVVALVRDHRSPATLQRRRRTIARMLYEWLQVALSREVRATTRARALTEQAPGPGLIRYTLPMKGGRVAVLWVPVMLRASEARRIGRWVETLSFSDAECDRNEAERAQ